MEKEVEEVVDKESGEVKDLVEAKPSTKTVVTTDETVKLLMVAENLFASGLFPNTKSPAGAFAVVLYGREIGVNPMTALQNINIINGKVACNGQLMLTLALERGVTYEILLETDEGCRIEFKRGDAKYTAEFTLNEAKQAGIYRPNSGWTKYPKDMCFWRAVTRGLRRIAPDVVSGLYSIDEVTESKYTTAEEIPIVSENKSAEPEIDLTPLKEELESLVEIKIIPDDKKRAFEYSMKNEHLHNAEMFERWIEEFKTYDDKGDN